MWKRGIVATGFVALVVACTGGNSASEGDAAEEELLPVPRAGATLNRARAHLGVPPAEWPGFATPTVPRESGAVILKDPSE